MGKGIGVVASTHSKASRIRSAISSTDSMSSLTTSMARTLGLRTVLGQASSVQLQGGFNTIRNQMVADATSQPDNDIVNFLPLPSQFSEVIPTASTWSLNTEPQIRPLVLPKMH